MRGATQLLVIKDNGETLMRKTALAALVVPVVVGVIAISMGLSWAVGGMGTPARTAPGGVAASGELVAPDETFYVVAYHWGWGVFKEDGTELDGIRVKEGTTVEIFAVNEHAGEAIEKLPAPVADAIMAIDWEKRTIEAVEKGLIPTPEDMTIEEALGIGHAHGVDEGHGHDEDDGHSHNETAASEDEHDENDGHGHNDGDDHHDEDAAHEDEHDDDQAEPLWPFMENHGFLIHQYGVVEYLEADAHEPVHVVFRADVPGAYQFICTNYCGYGHKYQPQHMLIVE